MLRPLRGVHIDCAAIPRPAAGEGETGKQRGSPRSSLHPAKRGQGRICKTRRGLMERAAPTAARIAAVPGATGALPTFRTESDSLGLR